MSEVANPKLEHIESVFKDAVWDNMVLVALSALFIKVPGLNVWLLKQIITWTAKRFSEHLYETLKLVVDLKAIAYLNAQHRREFENSAVILKIVAKNHGIDSTQFKEAREHAKKALSKFVRVGA